MHIEFDGTIEEFDELFGRTFPTACATKVATAAKTASQALKAVAEPVEKPEPAKEEKPEPEPLKDDKAEPVYEDAGIAELQEAVNAKVAPKVELIYETLEKYKAELADSDEAIVAALNGEKLSKASADTRRRVLSVLVKEIQANA